MEMQRETVTPHVHPILTGHFREGRNYATRRTRGTDSWLLILTLGGGGRFGHEGAETMTQAGDIAMLRPGVRHDYGTSPAAGEWNLLWAHFHPRPHWHEWLAWPEAAPGLMTLRLAEPIIRQKITARLLETHRLATGALRRREVFAMNAFEEVLLWCGTQNPLSEQARLDPRVRACLDALCADPAARLSLDQLADQTGLSVSRLSHLFRDQVGMTPQQFGERQRLERARQLLELSGRDIGDIAADVGYDNPFYFTLRFKKFTGFSPREYRKRSLTPRPSPPG